MTPEDALRVLSDVYWPDTATALRMSRAIDVLHAALAKSVLTDGPWQQLSDAATPGPWEATTSPGFVTGHLRAEGRNIADMRYRNGHADAALIVAAVNAVRACLDPDKA